MASLGYKNTNELLWSLVLLFSNTFSWNVSVNQVSYNYSELPHYVLQSPLHLPHTHSPTCSITYYSREEIPIGLQQAILIHRK